MRLPAWMSVPALLMAVPMGVIGALALYSLQSDQANLKVRQTSVAAERLATVQNHLRDRLDHQAETILENAGVLSGEVQRDRLQHMIYNGSIDFLTVHEGDRQIFPQSDGPLNFWTVQRKLQLMDGVLAQIRSDMAVNQQLTVKDVTLRLSGDTDYSLFHCRRHGTIRLVCILMRADLVLAALKDEMAKAQAATQDLELSLLTPESVVIGARGTGSAKADAEVNLSEPLSGWRVEARWKQQPSPWSSWIVPAAIIVPLLSSWLMISRYYYRVHLERLAAITRRADMAAHLSHELRTPLANLRLYTDLVVRKAGANAEISDYGTIMQSEIDRLTRLAEIAVASATGSSGDSGPVEEINPLERVQALVNRLQPLLQAAGSHVVVSGSAERTYRFDGLAFDRICLNLLDNARKYAKGADISITLWVEGRHLYWRIADLGPGIGEGQEEDIFKPMVRGNPALADGFGLGLAAVRRLARANGGDVRLEPTERGASFLSSLMVSTS